MDEPYVTTDQLLQLAALLKRTSDEERAAIRDLTWTLSKLTFLVAVMRKTHPDPAVMARAEQAVARAENNPDRIQALRELLATSVDQVVLGP